MCPTDKLTLQQVCVYFSFLLLLGVFKCWLSYPTTRREYSFELGRLRSGNIDVQSVARRTMYLCDKRKKW